MAREGWGDPWRDEDGWFSESGGYEGTASRDRRGNGPQFDALRSVPEIGSDAWIAAEIAAGLSGDEHDG